MALTAIEKYRIQSANPGFVKGTLYQSVTSMVEDSATEKAEVIVLPSQSADGIDDGTQVRAYRITKTIKNASAEIIAETVHVSETAPAWATAAVDLLIDE